MHAAVGSAGIHRDGPLAEQGQDEIDQVDAGLEQRPVEHLSPPPRLGPARQVHQLPDLREYESTGVPTVCSVEDGPKDRHLAKVVIERYSPIR